MVRRKNVLATMMHSMVALAVVGAFWLAIGYALAFGEPLGGTGWGSLIGWSSRLVFLHGVNPTDVLPGTNIPIYLHAIYQGMFAIITPALISGAVAERIRFKPYCLFLIAWTTFVYCPLAHWVWAMDWWTPLSSAEPGTHPVGWLGALGVLDFAGGIVVHISAGLSGLAAILLLRKRLGYPQHAMHPNSMVLTLLGAGLLWFGWFGFNGGSALGCAATGKVGSIAVSAFSATQAAAVGAALMWMLVEWWHRGKPTALGLASGMIAGLATVTPASGFIFPWGGFAIGLIAGAFCYLSVFLKPRLGYDDSLDAFGVHGVGGFLGVVLTGFFCSKAINPNVPTEGLFLGGGLGQVQTQLLGALAGALFALGATLLLVKIVDGVWGFLTDPESEEEGLDRTEHGEVGFDHGMPETESEAAPVEPRPALVPPNGIHHFTVVVEGIDQDELTHVWSDLCQAGDGPPSSAFRAIYPYMTTMQNNRFHFRGGDPKVMSENLSLVLQERLQRENVGVHVDF
jgi:ammonium transporter